MHMKISKKTIVLVLLATTGFMLLAQKSPKSFTAASYNVENLFDTINDPLTEDDAFTPQGEKAWTPERYSTKLEALARVISSIPSKDLPAIIGLTEVENLAVCEDLAAQRKLKKAGYRVIHEDGPDPRGIDCALLYNPEVFKYSGHSYLPVVDSRDTAYPHRSILHAEGRLPDGKDLHIFVNHWKSRSGGQKETEQMRMVSAITLKREISLLQVRDPRARIIILGDFNDEPTNLSLTTGLQAYNKRKNAGRGELFNLMYEDHNQRDLGTYNYRGNWNMLDQLIVSYNLLNQAKGYSTSFDGGQIFSEEWMMYESEKYGELLPSATYGGPNYYGGVSDHLPVYVSFILAQ